MIGWVDAQAGASGDMLLGALVAVGVPLAALQADLDELGLGLTLRAEPVTRSGLAATKVQVLVGGRPADGHQAAEDVHRSWTDVRALLDRLSHPAGPQEAFRRLALAEAAVHGADPDDVLFHEVGALDALADVVGVCAGFRHLGLQRLACSPVSLGSGTSRGAHGPLPVPVPAVLRLLDGAPVQAGPAPFESTTPTGAALLATLVGTWGPLPPMQLGRTGAGAGSRDSEVVCNALRLVLGTPVSAATTEHLVETNVDDLDPRLWPGVLEHLLRAGAVDAWLTPILMKKGRPAHTVSALVPEAALPAVRGVLFRETTTLGLRERPVDKHALQRTFTTVDVGGTPIAIKHAWYDGELVTSTPEWEDVARAAEALGLPAQQVLLSAQTSAKNASAPSPPASGTPTQS
ncbi:MAG TPA: nickel pincer cofactor biosynthesis protein LarC [Mycobacteriales bacterium]|nr:nickel pincer cofactor biosynthesis protein LarC [Mycobacteriales bacterium]